MVKLGWHFDFHSHKSVRIGHDPDFAGAAAALKEAGVDEVITFAKCHIGFSYYPTRIGTPHPRMKSDLFGGMLKACRKRGIRVFAYVSFGIDGEAARRHPEWAQVYARDSNYTPDHFISVCPYTGYLDELMLPQLDEIIRLYRPDGMWFDTMSALGLCYCASCRKDFQDVLHAEMPVDPEDPLWADYGRFRRERGLALVERVGRFVHKRLPKADLGFNQIGSVPYPERMPKSITRLTLDPPTNGHQSRNMGFCAAYGANADRPAEVMPTIFNRGWGDWTLTTRERMEKVAAVAWARKVRIFVGDRFRPEGRLDVTTLEALKIFKEIRTRISLLGAPDASEPDDEIVVLHTRSLAYGEDMRYFANDYTGRTAPLLGAYQLLGDAGASFTIVSEDFLAPKLRKAGLVVLPELPTLSAATSKLLQNFARQGGKLLFAGNIPTVDGKPLKWLGVESDVQPWLDHVWLAEWQAGARPMPVLFRGAFRKLKLSGAQAVLNATPPYDLRYGAKMGWGIGPASEKPSRFAALTRKRIGKGEAWYLEPAIFTDYRNLMNWQQIQWMSGLLSKIIPSPRAKLSETGGNVELIVRSAKKASWATLVNHGGEELALVPPGVGWSRALAPLPAYPVTVEFNNRLAPRLVTCDGAKCDFEHDGNKVSVPVFLDAPWKIVKVEWAALKDSSMYPKPLALQLYSLRQEVDHNFIGVLKEVSDMGFAGVETIALAGQNPTSLRKILDDLGLKICSAMVAFPTPQNINEFEDAARALGYDKIVTGFGSKQFNTLGARELGKMLKGASQLAKSHNLKLGVHNHWVEFEKQDGHYNFEILMEEAPEAFSEYDMYWGAYFGAIDPVETITRWKSRMRLLHVKDGPLKMHEPHTAVGAGKMNIPACIRAADPDVLEWLIVEIDNCAGDMRTAIRDSYRYLTETGLATGRK